MPVGRCPWENSALTLEILMARTIQSQSGRLQPAIGAFVGPLANAIFWLMMAIMLPLRSLVAAFPEFAPYVHWAPILFYALAFWSFIRAVRVLQRFAAGRTAPLVRARASAAAQAERRPLASKAKTSMGLPIHRTPTVQRMR